jgi:ATP-binding cassette subfamily F protein uup
VNDGKIDIEDLTTIPRHSGLDPESTESASLLDNVSEPQTKKQLSQKRTSLSNKERKQLKELNEKLETLETRKKELHELMTQHATDHEKMSELGIELSEVTNELWDVEEKWLELNE